jgi:hypothetical protein
MRIDNLSGMPEWEDDRFEEIEEGEEWKPNPTRESCKNLYNKWKDIVALLNGALSSIPDQDEGDTEEPRINEETDELNFPKSYFIEHKGMLLGDAYQVGVKIRSSEAGGLYIIRMENAAIIRKNAQFIQSNMLVLMEEGVVEKKYGYTIREEINEFKDLFKQWVATFERYDFEDEWGLFL